MDFVFYCVSCQGPLVARSALRGSFVQCAHCSGGIEARHGRTITEAVVSALLDSPLPVAPAVYRVLRRVRPAACHSSAEVSHSRSRLVPTARISKTR